MSDQDQRESVIYLPEGEGRAYSLGAMRSVFKADGPETKDTYSISEWWLEPRTKGPGPHSHEANDDIFYVLEGVITFLAGTEHIEASKGAFLRIPAGVTHDFENRSDQRAGLLNIYIPGGFEAGMPRIVAWFEKQGAGR
ncbi:cupin [Sorangium cellulosum]|uniref:Cupin n=1 Tax=Sorangium cellulosum TaxID=56 RepID=A0A2L0EIJ1_SORCE|nr:cupin domain-containing protein [Sorangium cellulosum]AUX39084.1 cupin [Sorangium cellulosum]